MLTKLVQLIYSPEAKIRQKSVALLIHILKDHSDHLTLLKEIVKVPFTTKSVSLRNAELLEHALKLGPGMGTNYE